MRNWNWIKRIHIFEDKDVASLPMRNWNLPEEIRNDPLNICCEPTYEELKPMKHILSMPEDIVASLPMRNWNSGCSQTTVKHALVASLPMRNWNPSILEEKRGVFFMLRAYLWGIETIGIRYVSRVSASLRAYLWGIETLSAIIALLLLHNRCEPTYEELKPSAVNMTKKTKFSCEPTYEELKLMIEGVELTEEAIELRAYLWGIETISTTKLKPTMNSCEPTYEELKQNRLLVLVLSKKVASLPMRNWNMHRIAEYNILQKGCEPTYEELKRKIFGIENKKAYKVASLPMRNWNNKYDTQQNKTRKVASLPMRNWNM